jgi:phosphotransferase system IIB component
VNLKTMKNKLIRSVDVLERLDASMTKGVARVDGGKFQLIFGSEKDAVDFALALKACVEQARDSDSKNEGCCSGEICTPDSVGPFRFSAGGGKRNIRSEKPFS